MPSTRTWISPLVKQTWIVSSVLLTMVSQGMLLGLTSCMLPALEAPGSDIKINLDTSSWLVASLPIFCIVGFFISSILMNIYGRRIAYGLELFPGMIGLTLTSYASNVFCLIAGRALSGISAGGTIVLGAVVIGEYTSPEHRAMFLNLKTAFLYLGSMAVHVLGHYLHWRTVSIVMMIPFVLALLIVYTWPESPSWLAEKKMYRQSEESFFWFREKTNESLKEIKEIIHAQRDKITKMTFLENVLKFFRKFTKKNFLIPVIIFTFAAILLEASGRHIFPAYAAKIINEIAGDTPNSFYFTLGIDLMITASSFFSSYLVRMLRLRTLLFTTGFISVLVLMIACLFLFISSTGVISKTYSWIPMSLFAMYFIFVNFGCAPIPLALIGEIFPLEHRAVGSSIAGYIIAVFMFITLKIIPNMILNLKIYGAFTVLSVAMVVSLIVLYFMLPETKNRSLQEIDNFFRLGKYKEGEDEVIEGLVDVNKPSDSV